MHKMLFIFLLFFSQTVFAQFHLGIFLGASTYNGDLSDKPFQVAKPAIGVSLNYEISDRVILRSGLTFSKLEANDKYNSSIYKKSRNLDFQSPLTEFSLMAEVNIFNLNTIKWTPYYFAGIAVYHFNPYTIDSNRKVYLQPLSTEGEGLAAYPDRKPYSLTQFAIPFGGGFKFKLTDDICLGVETGIRKLFTDYLDDVSNTYAERDVLLAEKGPQTVELAYRGTGNYPSKNDARGDPKYKDWYLFTGVHLTFRLGGGYGKTDASGNRKGYGCPSNPM